MEVPKVKPQSRRSLTETLMDPRQVSKTLNEQAFKLRSKWRKVVTGDEKKRIRDRIRETQEEPKFVKFFDKIAFTIGVLNMGVCQYFLLNRPDLFPMWYSLIIPLILGSRYFYFRGGGLQYFMIDFCYFAIFCSMLNLLVLRNYPVFFKVCYICCTGPLTLAIPVWRNSFVFHDYDKIVSVYIHILPSMLYYTMRHRGSHLDLLWGGNMANICTHESCDTLRVTDYLIALALYMFWQFAYLVKTEYLDKSKLDNNPELLTSLRWLAKDTKNAMARGFLKFYRKLGVFGKDEEYDSRTLKTKAVFVVAQLIFTVVSFMPTPFMYYSPAFHLIYILLIVTSSVFNGASFYIEVFSKRYNTHILKIEEMHQIAIAAKSAMTGIATLKSTADGSKTNLEAAAVKSSSKPGSPVPESAPAGTSSTASAATTASGSDTSTEAPLHLSVPIAFTADHRGPEERSVDHLTKLTELLQRTSDSAWLQMREHYERADALRGGRSGPALGITAEENFHDYHEDEYVGMDLAEGEEECLQGVGSHSSESSQSPCVEHKSDGLNSGNDVLVLETDLAVEEEDLFSPETRKRVNSLMSIDR